LDWKDLTNARGFQVREPSMNFPAPWPGGTWGLLQIVDYQESGVMAPLKNAARNRRYWVDNFHEINRRAVSTRSTAARSSAGTAGPAIG
jgi:hypothetical protein